MGGALVEVSVSSSSSSSESGEGGGIPRERPTPAAKSSSSYNVQRTCINLLVHQNLLCCRPQPTKPDELGVIHVTHQGVHVTYLLFYQSPDLLSLALTCIGDLA